MEASSLRTWYLFPVVICFLVTGCSALNQPDYSLLVHVPAGRVEKVKDAIKHSEIANVQLPTEFPYPVDNANVPNNYFSLPPHHFDIYIGNNSHIIVITIQNAPQNAVVSKSSVDMQGESRTKLTNGTPALYGKSESVSQLAWDKNGVSYTISSTTEHNKPDLTEQQLVNVADSFK